MIFVAALTVVRKWVLEKGFRYLLTGIHI